MIAFVTRNLRWLIRIVIFRMQRKSPAKNVWALRLYKGNNTCLKSEDLVFIGDNIITIQFETFSEEGML